MRIYRDLNQIQTKEKRGRRLSGTGLVILFIGLLASFVPNIYPPGQPTPNAIAAFLQANWSLISLVALPAGFIFASLGSYFINRFARRRWPGGQALGRPDEVVERSLKGFDDKYALFIYSLPAPYVLIGPCGVINFAVRGDKGRIKIAGDRWREPFNFRRFFTVFAREGLGNPPRDLQEEEGRLRGLLAQVDEMEDGESDKTEPLAEVPIDGAVLFLNNDVQLEVDEPSVPVLMGKQAKNYVRQRAKEVRLRTSTLRRLREELVAVSTGTLAE